MPWLISACLLGIPCRYDGKSKGLSQDYLQYLKANYDLIPICPEIYGGLPTPRPPAEIQGDKVMTQKGEDFTKYYQRGAAATAKIAEVTSAEGAFLAARSPSCGVGSVYDGTFQGKVVAGDGITAQKLREMALELKSLDPKDEVE